MLLEFTVACLINRPDDLVDYAVEYFTHLRDSSSRPHGFLAKKSSEEINGDVQSESSDEDPDFGTHYRSFRSFICTV
jgi:hypothetical protein